MSVLGVLGLGMSAGGSIGGQMAAQQATQQSAQSQLEIGRLNRAFQQEMFEEQLGQQQPYIELGAKAAPMLQRLIQERDYMGAETPAMQFQTGQLGEMMAGRFGDVSPGVMDRLGTRQRVMGREATKNRLFDMLKIGSGAAASAGQSGQVMAGALSEAMMRSAGIRGGMATQQYVGQQNLANQMVQGVGAIPAYMQWQRYQGSTT